MSQTKKVTLAFPYIDADGKERKADSTVSLPRHEANRLLARGLAREPEAPKPTTKKAAAKHTTEES
jgi:topoisomerase IA-like protein